MKLFQNLLFVIRFLGVLDEFMSTIFRAFWISDLTEQAVICIFLSLEQTNEPSEGILNIVELTLRNKQLYILWAVLFAVPFKTYSTYENQYRLNEWVNAF